MFRKRLLFLLALACLEPQAAIAAESQDCDLKLITSVDMLSFGSNRPMVPVTINGAPKLLLLDTGGITSQLSRAAANQLKLVPFEVNARLYDASGESSRSAVVADNLTLGKLIASHMRLMVAPMDLGEADGLMSTDMLLRYDVDMDFGANKLTYFSPQHCPGKVLYWSPKEVAEVPLTVNDKLHFAVQIKLDGKPFNAVIDTGATSSVISMPVARSIYGLAPDSPGMAPAGPLNGDPRLSSYRHTFSNLTFDGVAITNPTLLIVPDRMGGDAIQTGSHIPTGDPNIKLPEMLLGMDVMRHLHMYFAFQEKKLYVSATSPAPADAAEPERSQTLAFLDKAVSLSPTNAALLNNRCFARGLANTQLDGALADCDASLQTNPSNPNALDSKGLVLYRLGRFADALGLYNAALKLNPKLASSLYMRGQTKRKLGNTVDGDADLTAAKKLDPNVNAPFQEAGITE